MKPSLNTKKNDSNKKDNQIPKPFVTSIVKVESFNILGAQGDDEYEEICFENGNMPPQFLQNQHMGEEGDYGGEGEENDEGDDEQEQINIQDLTEEQKQMSIQMQMQQMEN